MRSKYVNITITLCINIVILFILYLIMILISSLTKYETTNQIIAGINPIVSTKSSTSYQMPLTVILESEKTIVNEKPQEEVAVKEENIQEEQETIKIEENNDLKTEQQNTQEEDELKQQTQNNEQETSQQPIINEDIEQPQEVQEPVLAQYNGFATVGKIEIPKTGVDIPILNQVTVKGMKSAPCLLYSTGNLNQDGNNLIVGHNYRNGTIFSNNKYLDIGDKIYITTLDNQKMEYTIYNKFITTAEDVTYIKRDTFNKPEITLSCCTDNDEQRIIILAKID